MPMEEDQLRSKAGSGGTLVASLAAAGQRDCGLELLHSTAAVSLRRGSSRRIRFFRPAAALSAWCLGVVHCVWFLQIVARETVRRQTELDQRVSSVVLDYRSFWSLFIFFPQTAGTFPYGCQKEWARVGSLFQSMRGARPGKPGQARAADSGSKLPHSI